MANISLRVNGQSRMVATDPTTPLLYVLRNDLDLHGPRFGCGVAQCGACTVIVDGAAVRSCVTPVRTVENKAITTLCREKNHRGCNDDGRPNFGTSPKTYQSASG